jgi:Ricin-type beta-trefoil lectin domain
LIQGERTVLSVRRLAILLIALTFVLAGGATAWLTGAGAAVPATKAAPPGDQPYESDLIIKSAVDPNFCLANTPAPENPASVTSVSQCVANPDQAWMFADAEDGSVVIIGNTGQCLGLPRVVGSPVTVTPCSFKGDEHLYFTEGGQIESASGKYCLEASAATQDGQVYADKCQSAVKTQFWKLAH